MHYFASIEGQEAIIGRAEIALEFIVGLFFAEKAQIERGDVALEEEGPGD